MHLHLTSHLGTLDAPREGCAEPEDGAWRIHSEDGRTKQVLGPEMPSRWCQLTELTCVGSQASPGALQASYFMKTIEYICYICIVALSI
jgi:hypothetical protein